MNLIELSNDFCQKYLSCFKKAAQRLQLTQSQSLCLSAIPFKGISQTDLANKLSLDLSTLSRNLNKLSIKEFISKTSSNHDKRISKIYLTERGQDIYNQLNNLIADDLSKIFNAFDVDEQSQMEEMLNKINWQFDLLNK
tara:strand:+ start:97 stop:513 length:417 start_codon:yes stop_codon:yes gene_type:complete